MYKRTYGITPNTLSGFIEDVLHNGYNRVTEEMNSYSVPVNIQENETSYEMQLAAPGLNKDEFKINIEQNILQVSYERKEESKEQQAGKTLRNEFKIKSFKRSFTLNDKIDTSKITAKYADGLLHLTLAKKEVSIPKTQEISVN
jgi:HSP20 family protein